MNEEKRLDELAAVMARLKLEMQLRRIDKYALAQLAGVATSHMHQLFTGRRLPSIAVIVKFEVALELEAGTLMPLSVRAGWQAASDAAQLEVFVKALAVLPEGSAAHLEILALAEALAAKIAKDELERIDVDSR